MLPNNNITSLLKHIFCSPWRGIMWSFQLRGYLQMSSYYDAGIYYCFLLWSDLYEETTFVECTHTRTEEGG